MNTNVYDTFQQEFGRLLTPIEKNIILEWQSSFKDDTILSALKEAVFSGAVSFRYINKILEKWKTKFQESNDVVLVTNDDLPF